MQLLPLGLREKSAGWKNIIPLNNGGQDKKSSNNMIN